MDKLIDDGIVQRWQEYCQVVSDKFPSNEVVSVSIAAAALTIADMILFVAENRR